LRTKLSRHGRILATPEFKVDEGTPAEGELILPKTLTETPRERSPTAARFSVVSSSRTPAFSYPPDSQSSKTPYQRIGFQKPRSDSGRHSAYRSSVISRSHCAREVWVLLVLQLMTEGTLRGTRMRVCLQAARDDEKTR
jgi:hypothetical protein